jgi:hypothetical protein
VPRFGAGHLQSPGANAATTFGSRLANKLTVRAAITDPSSPTVRPFNVAVPPSKAASLACQYCSSPNAARISSTPTGASSESAKDRGIE